jgi:hypothetical protein
MAIYARVNSLTLKVDNVIETDKSFFNERTDYDLWIKTSAELTKKIASIGDTYDATNNQFKSDSPYASWVFNNSTWRWEAPSDMPEIVGDKSYYWHEDTTSWKEIT